MGDILIDTEAVVLALQKVYKERHLSIDKAHAIVNEAYPDLLISRSTIAKLFRKGGEKDSYNYESTLRPIANALLKIEDIAPDDEPETVVYKSILKLKKDTIDDFEEKQKDYDELKSQIAHYQETLDLLRRQIDYKDERIDKLLAANERQSITIEQMTAKLLSCPCPHKEGACQ